MLCLEHEHPALGEQPTRYGFRRACVAGLGRLLAFAGMIALASARLAVVLKISRWLFHAIKILDAAHMIYLTVQLWRAKPKTKHNAPTPDLGLWVLARQEFLVAAGKPNDGQYKIF